MVGRMEGWKDGRLDGWKVVRNKEMDFRKTPQGGDPFAWLELQSKVFLDVILGLEISATLLYSR